MAVILRFVDCNGIIRERFFEVVGVDDTIALTLKKKKNCCSYSIRSLDCKNKRLRV